MMDNVPILEELKVCSHRLPGFVRVIQTIMIKQFGVGDGFLNFYLYNWRTTPLAGMTAEGDVPAGQGVGVVML